MRINDKLKKILELGLNPVTLSVLSLVNDSHSSCSCAIDYRVKLSKGYYSNPRYSRVELLASMKAKQSSFLIQLNGSEPNFKDLKF